MRGHQKGLRMRFQHHFQQIAGIKAQDGPPVGFDVAHLCQAARQAVCGVHVGHVDKVVHLAHLAAAFVDAADFGLEHEQGAPGQRLARVLRQFGVQPARVAQAVQAAGFVQHQLFGQFLPPLGVREVAGAEHVQPLHPRPRSQMAGVEPTAGGARKAGVDVQVGPELLHRAGSCGAGRTGRERGRGAEGARPGTYMTMARRGSAVVILVYQNHQRWQMGSPRQTGGEYPLPTRHHPDSLPPCAATLPT